MDINNSTEVGQVVAELPIVDWTKAAVDGATANATAETVIGTVGPGVQGLALGAVQFVPAAALVADNANYATLTVTKRTNGVPGTPVTIATATTQITGTGNWTAWKAVTIPLAAGAFVSPLDTISIAITKTGTGVVVPQGVLGIFPTQT
jgi:hypothetical protein